MNVPSKRTLDKFGLTEWQYIDLWNLCQGRCPLCDKKFSITRPAAIDHDHRTFEVRGLICSQCNLRLGEMHENVKWMDNAVRYLRCPPTKQLWAESPRVANAPPLVMEND